MASLELISVTFQVSAQAKVDKVDFNKSKQDCFSIEYSFPTTAVENAFLLKMERIGYKGKEEKGLFNKDKGFRVYKEITISEISNKNYDYVINIEKESKRNDDKSVFYLLIMKESENLFTQLSAGEMANAKKYLADLVPEIEVANLELMIIAQEEILTKAEKKFKDMQDEKSDMEKKIAKLQDDIKRNEKDQEDQQKEIESQKKTLEDLKQKRKN
jgi:hypothetical protein